MASIKTGKNRGSWEKSASISNTAQTLLPTPVQHVYPRILRSELVSDNTRAVG
jgi:hypothetical protein